MSYCCFSYLTETVLAYWYSFSEKVQFELYLATRNVAIIIDESAKLKNPDAALTKTFFDLAPFFQKRVIMTGTPVANRPYDIWAQIYFLDQGKSLGTDFKVFKRETDLSNKLSESTDLQFDFEDSVSRIHTKIRDFSVRETKNSGIIELPDKVCWFKMERKILACSPMYAHPYTRKGCRKPFVF